MLDMMTLMIWLEIHTTLEVILENRSKFPDLQPSYLERRRSLEEHVVATILAF